MLQESKIIGKPKLERILLNDLGLKNWIFLDNSEEFKEKSYYNFRINEVFNEGPLEPEVINLRDLQQIEVQEEPEKKFLFDYERLFGFSRQDMILMNLDCYFRFLFSENAGFDHLNKRINFDLKYSSTLERDYKYFRFRYYSSRSRREKRLDLEGLKNSQKYSFLKGLDLYYIDRTFKTLSGYLEELLFAISNLKNFSTLVVTMRNHELAAIVILLLNLVYKKIFVFKPLVTIDSREFFIICQQLSSNKEDFTNILFNYLNSNEKIFLNLAKQYNSILEELKNFKAKKEYLEQQNITISVEVLRHYLPLLMVF